MANRRVSLSVLRVQRPPSLCDSKHEYAGWNQTSVVRTPYYPLVAPGFEKQCVWAWLRYWLRPLGNRRTVRCCDQTLYSKL